MVQIIHNVWMYLSFPYPLLLILFLFFLLSFFSCPSMNTCIFLMCLHTVYQYLLLVNRNSKWFVFFLEFCKCDLYTPFLSLQIYVLSSVIQFSTKLLKNIRF